MTTVTKVGLEWISDKTLDNEVDVVDEIAVGTDGSSEVFTATALGSEEYRAAFANPNVTLTETDDEGEYEVSVDVTGGTEVPASTVIRELALFTSGGTMLLIGNITGVNVGSGETEQFRITFDPDLPA